MSVRSIEQDRQESVDSIDKKWRWLEEAASAADRAYRRGQNGFAIEAFLSGIPGDSRENYLLTRDHFFRDQFGDTMARVRWLKSPNWTPNERLRPELSPAGLPPGNPIRRFCEARAAMYEIRWASAGKPDQTFHQKNVNLCNSGKFKKIDMPEDKAFFDTIEEILKREGVSVEYPQEWLDQQKELEKRAPEDRQKPQEPAELPSVGDILTKTVPEVKEADDRATESNVATLNEVKNDDSCPF